VGTPLSIDRPLWTANLLAKRRRRRPRRISHGPTPRNEKFFTLSSKAGSNVVASAAILMEFVVSTSVEN
jgi:hypothetical protein